MAVERIIPEWIHHFVPNTITLYALGCVLIGAIISLAVRRRKFIQRVDRVPGVPGGMTILGNTPMIIVSPDGNIWIENYNLFWNYNYSQINFGY